MIYMEHNCVVKLCKIYPLRLVVNIVMQDM